MFIANPNVISYEFDNKREQFYNSRVNTMYEKDITKDDIIENVFDVVYAISNDFNDLKEKLNKAFMVLKENKVIYEYKLKIIKDSEILSVTYKFYPNVYPNEEFHILTVVK